MAFQQTSASDIKDLLNVISTFAQSQGWTEEFNDAASNGQLGLSKGNAHITLGEKPGENPVVRTDEVNGGTVDDAYLYMVANESINPAIQTFWGQPNSVITSDNDSDRPAVNDLAGAFSNVWLYSNATGDYIHVVVQSSAARYTTFSFGEVDAKGQSVPEAGYVCGITYTWWPSIADYAGNNNADWIIPQSSDHRVGFFGDNRRGVTTGFNALMVHLPDGVVDPVLGFTDGPFQSFELKRIVTRGDEKDDAVSGTPGRMLDHFLASDNSLTTGGIPLSGLSVMYEENDLAVFLGDLPDVRLVNMGNINPAQEIKFGADTWQCFPLKRKGVRSETAFGINPQPLVNSIEYGLAVKKIV